VNKWIAVAVLAWVVALVQLPEHRAMLVYFTVVGTFAVAFAAGCLAALYYTARGAYRLLVVPFLAAFATEGHRIARDRELDALQLQGKSDSTPRLVPHGTLVVTGQPTFGTRQVWIPGSPGSVFINSTGFGTVVPAVPGFWSTQTVATGFVDVVLRQAGREEFHRHWACGGSGPAGAQVEHWTLSVRAWRDLQRWMRHAGKSCLADQRAWRIDWDRATKAAHAAVRRDGALRIDKSLVEHVAFDPCAKVDAYAGIDAIGQAVIVESGKVVYRGPAERLFIHGAGRIGLAEGNPTSRSWPEPVLRRVAYLRQRAELAKARPVPRPFWKRLLGVA
jgi:hypothetical protein